MSYIVKNCPCLFNSYYASGKTVRFECNDGNHDDKLCRDVTDCVIKQVIDRCKKRSGKCERCKASEDYQPTDCLDYCSNDDVIFENDILQLFDIEEINK